MKKRLLGLMAAVFALAASAYAFSACDLGGSNTGDTDNTGGNTQVPDDGNNDNPSGGEHTVHSYTEKNTDDKYLKSKATCKNKAVYYFSCSCGEKGKTTFEYGELAEHTEVIDKAVEPTCTKAGKTAGKHCSVCNKVLVEQTVIPAAHKEVIDEEIPATCTTDGKTAGKHCSVCKKVLVAQEAIPASGHNYETTMVDATETAHGSITYTCSGCGDTYTDVLHNIVEGECTVCHDSTAAVKYVCVWNGKNYLCYVSGLNDKTVNNIIILPTYDDGEHGELSVTSIGYGAFRNCSGLTSIEIPNSVTSIGSSAFSGCSGLTSIEIPDGVTSIDEGAFSGCSGLTSIEIPDGVTSIGGGAFSGCIGLTSIIIPNSVTSIDDSAFRACIGLTSVVIPDSVTSIGNMAFSGCRGLTSIEIPRSVRSISGSAFSDCIELTSITVGEGNKNYKSESNCLLTKDGKFLIAGCKTSVVPDSVTSIGESAFIWCSGLTSIVIPDSVTSVDGWAFSGCSKLTSVTIGNGVTSIGERAFNDCSGLTSITIPDSVTSIGERAFSDCSGLTIYCEAAEKPSGWNSNWNSSNCPVVWNCKTDDIASDGNIYTVAGGVRYAIKDGVATVVGQSQAISGEVVISSTVEYKGTDYAVTGIGDNAFRGCSGLTSITIPDSVTSINGSVFTYCNGLTIYCETAEQPSGWNSNWNYNVYDNYNLRCPVVWGCKTNDIADDGNIYTVAGGVRYSIKDGVATVAIQPQTISGEVVISSTVEYKGTNYAVTSIRYKAFNGCGGLTSIVIPDSVTSIDGDAFWDCSGLTSITIPDSVTSIGGGAFNGCSGIIQTEGGVQYVDNWAIGCNTSVTEVTLRSNTRAIGERAFNGCIGLTSVVIPDSVTSIGWKAFYDCSGLTSIVIPSSVASIGGSAFDGCSGLTSVTISNGVTSIGDNAFCGCSGLTSIIIPDSVTSIGEIAFGGCSGLTIYCEAAEKPSGWHSNWNYNGGHVVWGYTGEE